MAKASFNTKLSKWFKKCNLGSKTLIFGLNLQTPQTPNYDDEGGGGRLVVAVMTERKRCKELEIWRVWDLKHKVNNRKQN